MDPVLNNTTGLATTSLPRYLPRPLLDAIRPGSGEDERLTADALHPCAAHLESLLRAVITYLPRYLVQELLADPQPGRVSGAFREATIMFTDISGFTAMSERLSQHGEEGAEKITQIVGDYFTRLIDIAACQGGDLLKFGGDALLVAFGGDDDPTTHDHAINAVRAAVQMQEAIARFSQVEAFGETFHLKMTAGIGSGSLFTANLGTADKMEYTVMGEALVNMARAEDQAEGGEIFIDELTYQMVKAAVQVGEVRNGCYRVTHVSGGDLRCTETPPIIPLPRAAGNDVASLTAHLHTMLACLDALTPFLPPGLLDLLRFDPVHMAARERGEFRPVTTMFANFYGIEEIIHKLGPDRAAEITAILNTHFTTMQEIIQRYDGVIDKVDSYVVGHRIMALFGAPRAHVDDPERAVRAAWEMQTAMHAFADLQTSAGNFALKQRIGINSGRVFAGNVGSERRHEYSVMGDEVNLTARLMSAAQENQILLSQSTAAQAGHRFRLEQKTPVKVKGKQLPVVNYEVQGLIEQTGTTVGTRTPLIGRDAEWQAVQTAVRAALSGTPQSLSLVGEMGMGKSRLIEELIADWTVQNGRAFTATCLSYTAHAPYAPWIPLLRDLFGLRQDDGEAECAAKIDALLITITPEWQVWTPLIAQLIGVNIPDTPLLRALDAKLRRQNAQRIIGELLLAEAAHHPLLLVFDDIQWLDDSSAALLEHVLAHAHAGPHAVLICTAYRPEEVEKRVVTHPQTQVIHLGPLDEFSSMTLLDRQLPTAPAVPQRLKEMILKNAQGTPLFIVEMAHALIENYMSYDAADGVYRAREDLAYVQVPDTVSRIILSRLDRLDEPSRTMLKVASAIGRVFQEWLLQQVYSHRAASAEIQNNLIALCEKEILDRTSGRQFAEVAYLFRHVMTREVAYESLLYAERRELHRRIAESIETQIGDRADEYVETLADHYTLAEVWDKALTYHLRAARRAQAVYANQDAVHRYEQALQAAQHVDNSQADQVAACEGLGNLYELLGQYPKALQYYEQARTILTRMPPSELTQRYRADLCRKTGRVYELQGDYETALEWIRRGLALIGASECLETAQLYLGGAAIFQREGKWAQVIEWCEQGLEIVKKLDSPEAQQTAAHAYYLLGNGHRRQGNIEQAWRDYQQSLDTYCALGDRPGMARAYNNLANLNLDRGDWAQASDYYQQALVILEHIGDLPGQAILANNLGGVLLNRGKFKNARIYYMQSLKISQELGINFGIALLNNNLGHVAIRESKAEQALTYLRKSLEGFEKIGSQEFMPELYRHFAEAYLLMNDLLQAHRWATRSLERAVQAGLKLEEGCTRRVLGCIYRLQGKHQEARQELETGLHLLESLGNPYQIAQTQVELAALYDLLNLTEQSTALRRRAQETFERLGAEGDLAALASNSGRG